MEWLAYCEEKEVRSRMTSYRSNRFNSFFEGAAVIIHHRRTLLSFFRSRGHSNLKMQSVEANLADNRLLAFVAAVALLYIYLTEPCWELLQSKVKCVKLYHYINPMMACIERYELLLIFLKQLITTVVIADFCWNFISSNLIATVSSLTF